MAPIFVFNAALVKRIGLSLFVCILRGYCRGGRESGWFSRLHLSLLPADSDIFDVIAIMIHQRLSHEHQRDDHLRICAAASLCKSTLLFGEKVIEGGFATNRKRA